MDNIKNNNIPFAEDYSAFLTAKPKDGEVKTITVIPSNDYKGADGKPVKWKLRKLSTKEFTESKAGCYQIMGMAKVFDADKYSLNLVIESLVYPNMKNAAIQDHYGVTQPDELLMALLPDMNDYMKLLNAFNELHGDVNQGIEADIKIVKNS